MIIYYKKCAGFLPILCTLSDLSKFYYDDDDAAQHDNVCDDNFNDIQYY